MSTYWRQNLHNFVAWKINIVTLNLIYIHVTIKVYNKDFTSWVQFYFVEIMQPYAEALTQTHIYTHTQTHIYTHTRTHTHTYTHTHRQTLTCKYVIIHGGACIK